MSRDDYFKIIYLILKELYESKKSNELVDLSAIGVERLQINPGYLLGIYEDLLDAGYVKGFFVKSSKTGKYIIECSPRERG